MSDARTIQVVNGGDTIYKGTVVSGLPVAEGLVFDETHDIRAFDPKTGFYYEAAYEILTRFDGGVAPGSAKWALVGIHGSFEPGITELVLEVNPGGIREPNFIPENWEWSRNVRVEAELIDPLTTDVVPFSLDLSTLTPDNGTVHYANEVFMTLEWEGSTNIPDVHWRAFAFLRKGERGIRWEFQFENHAPGYMQPGNEPGIMAEWRLVYPRNQHATEDQIISIGRGYVPPTETRIGDMHIAWGAETGPLTMEHYAGTDTTTVTLVDESSYIPQGGPWAPPARPGDPASSSSSVDPRSTLGLFFHEKIMVEFFIGDPMAQEHVNCPPQLVLADKTFYDKYILGGMVASVPFQDEEGTYILENTERYERLISAYVDPEACDPFPASQEKITYRAFAERGGTYPTAPDKNAFFGIRDFGDDVWGSGYGGANHYQAADSCLRQWLRSSDPRWFFEGHIRNRHFRIWDFSWGGPSTNPFPGHKFDGMSTYEKGYHHGNTESPKVTHTWAGSAALGYVLTGHPEFLRLCRQNAACLVTHYTFWGADYVAGPGTDPRDWGGPTKNPYGSMAVRAPQGDYGDWGIRKYGRALENAAAHLEYLGEAVSAYDLRSYMALVCKQVERIETQIWGGNGYILNRASRGNLVSDSEQGWMHCYVTRGLGYAMIYGGEATEEYRPLYERWYNFLLNQLIVYGDKDAQGRVRPPRVAGFFGQNGPEFVTRVGIRSSTLQKWYTWRSIIDRGDNDPAAFNDWYHDVLADVQRLDNVVEQNGDSSWLKAEPSFQAWVAALARIDAAGGVTTPTSSDYTFIRSKQWNFLQSESYPAVNHGMLAADTLAQGAIHLGMNVQGVAGFMAVRLAENNIWHLQDTAAAPYYADIRDNRSDISYRMPMFPFSETKINPNQLDSQYLRSLLAIWDQFIGTPTWGPEADAILQSYLNAADTAAGAAYASPDEETVANLDANGDLSPFIADPNEDSARLVQLNNPLAF